MRIKQKSWFSRWKVLLTLPSFLLFVFMLCSNVLSSTVPYDENPCETPDKDLTVIIDGCDSGVNNIVVDETCSVSDEITKCAINAEYHNEFVSCVARLTNDLKKNGKITNREKGEIQSCAAKSDIPYDEPVVVVPDEPQRFHFETATDHTSIAINKVYKALTTTPTPETNMIELEELRDEGIAYLSNNPLGASEFLIYEALLLDPFDVGRHLSIFHLLSSFDSGTMGVEYLVAQVQRPLPEDCSYGRCLDVRMIRSAALDTLGQMSTIGSSIAKEKVLSFVTSEDVTIQRKAVGLVYKTGGMSRWLAKIEMKNRLPFCKRHLLYELY